VPSEAKTRITKKQWCQSLIEKPIQI